MKKILYLTFFMAFLGSPAWAETWAIVVNSHSMTISMIEYTCPYLYFSGVSTKVYGPYLTGSLGSPGNLLLDVATTPDNKYALVSNYGQHKVYRIDISDPTNPILAGALDLGTFAPEDIAISPNGQFAVISSDASVNKLVFINPTSFSGYSLYTLTSPNGYANAVDVGKDNSTIILCDYNHSRIIYGQVNATHSGLVSESSLPTDDYPINVAISPDGSTALVACTGGSVCVFEIAGPGTLKFGVFREVRGFHDSPQSIAFSGYMTGYAYVVCNDQPGSPTTLSMLRVNGSGNVSMGKERAATLCGYSGAAYYGVDVIVVPCPEIYSLFIVGNPSSNLDSRNRVCIVLAQPGRPDPFFSPGPLNDTQYDAKGVAIFSSYLYPPSNASLSRLTNNYIFYKEYINRLTWQANEKNISPIGKYRIFRKSKGAQDSTYQQLTEVDGSVFQYDERGLKKTDSYTYRIIAITPGGRESAPVEVSNVVVMKRAGSGLKLLFTKFGDTKFANLMRKK